MLRDLHENFGTYVNIVQAWGERGQESASMQGMAEVAQSMSFLTYVASGGQQQGGGIWQMSAGGNAG